MALPSLPSQGQDPWFDTRTTWDNAVDTELGVRLSPDGIANSSVTALSNSQGVVYPAGSALGAITYASVQAAATLASTSGQKVWAAGTLTTDQTLTINSDADMAGLTINYNGTGTAVVFGSTTAVSSRRVASLPRVINTNKTIVGWSQVVGTVGVLLVNLNSCPQLIVPYIRGFETGLLTYGQGQGFVHNTIPIGQLLDNKVNQKVDANSTGWNNQNVFMNGRLAHSSAEGSNVAGVRHIEMVAGTSNPINTNTWVGTSVEGSCPEYHVMFAGSDNSIYQGRFEASPCRVFWQDGATRNSVIWGYRAQFITEVYGTGAVSNVVLAPVSRISMSSTLGWQFESTTSSNPVLLVTESGSQAAGESAATSYSFRLSSLRCSMKRRTDAADRVRIDGQNGVFYLGSGVADPVMFFANDGALGLRMSAPFLRPNANNTTDLGTDANRFRNEYLSGFVSLGEISDPAAPGADTARLFVRDNGSGKSQLCIRFATGAVQVISTEP